MGYEVRIHIVEEGFESREIAKEEVPKFDEVAKELYYPPKKDDKGDLAYTGRKEVYCRCRGTIELFKVGYYSEITKIDNENHNSEEVFYYIYQGDTKLEKDSYGVSLALLPVSVVLNAIRSDLKGAPNYSPFVMAEAALSACPDSYMVMVEGH